MLKHYHKRSTALISDAIKMSNQTLQIAKYIVEHVGLCQREHIVRCLIASHE